MSNFRPPPGPPPVPHPSQTSSNSLVYLSIWSRPKSHTIGLIQPWLVQFSGVSPIELKLGGMERCGD